MNCLGKKMILSSNPIPIPKPSNYFLPKNSNTPNTMISKYFLPSIVYLSIYFEYDQNEYQLKNQLPVNQIIGILIVIVIIP